MVQRILWLAALLLLCAPLCYAEVYKWVDENGEVHYSNKPPPEIEAETVKVPTETDDKPLKAPPYLRGYWEAKHDGKSIVLMIDDKGWFLLEKVRGQPGEGDMHMEHAFAGSWRRREKRLTFRPTYRGIAANDVLPPDSAIFITADWKSLSLDWKGLGRIDYQRRMDINNGSTYKPFMLDR